MFSKLGTLQLNDWWKGLIVAVITVPITIIYQSVSTGNFTFDWKAILMGAIAGGCAYLLKNLGTGTQGKMLTNK